MKSKLEIYALSVCFVAVLCIVISAGIAGYSFFKVVTPELTMNTHTYNILNSNKTYWDSKKNTYEYNQLNSNEAKKDSCSKEVKPSEEELTKQRNETFLIAVNAEKRQGFQSLIKCFMFLLFAGIALIIHWKIAKKSQVA